MFLVIAPPGTHLLLPLPRPLPPLPLPPHTGGGGGGRGEGEEEGGEVRGRGRGEGAQADAVGKWDLASGNGKWDWQVELASGICRRGRGANGCAVNARAHVSRQSRRPRMATRAGTRAK